MKRWCGIFLVVAVLIAGWHWQADADVTGDVTLQLGMFPIATQTEAVEFNIDFEVLTNIKWTISGLTFGSRLALGVPGIEHSIFSVETQLGAFDVLSESVFATPFSNGIPDDIDSDSILNFVDPDIDGDGVANLADGTPFGVFQAFIKEDIDGDGVPNAVDPDIDGDGTANGVDATPFGVNFAISPITRPIGPTLFVKKRFTTNINLAGFNITNLAIFEDINFTHPFLTSVQTYGASFQEFRFGNILTISGQTVSGISFRSVTGLGADPDIPSLIKKATFLGSVCENNNPGVQADALALCVEQLFIDNIRIGSLTISSRSEFELSPLAISETLTMRHGFFDDMVTATLTLTMQDVISLTPLSTSIFINSAPLTVSIAMDNTFTITTSTATLSVSIDSSVVSSTVVFLPTTGINSLSFRFQTTTLSGLSVFANTVFSSPGAGPKGGFGSMSTTFTVNGNITSNFGVNSSMSFGNTGITSLNAQLTFRF